ncbi:hypothetical protein [Amnibacterium sp.]|uniref:hypothetical protein n=1 Tax=Amnibacterium sp. TaxID=1872496 RepID=UPI002636AB10|nr:hypothetical protein [Amnibacterium sp.]MCU1475133.1 hypothetical protein [Amnibacterium sp.]
MIGPQLMDVTVGTALLDTLLIGGAGVTVTVGAVATTAVLAVRRIRRSPAVTAASLRMRSITESGPRREVVRLRLQLLQAVDGGRAAIGAADPSVGLPGDAPVLFRRIQAEAKVVDQHLRVLQSEDDRDALRAALPAMRRRVTELVGLVRQLRAAVAAGLEAASDGAMTELRADVEREVTALRAGQDRLRNRDGLPSGPGWTTKGAIR